MTLKYFLCIFLSLSIFSACEKQQTKTALPNNRLQKINGKKVLKLVQKQLDFGPRHSGSPAAKKTSEWIAQYAESLGYNVQIDPWFETHNKKEILFKNIIVTKKGKSKDFIIVATHYDTKVLAKFPLFNGANDGASSTALLLHILKNISESKEWDNNNEIRFLFFDGEEAFKNYTYKDGLRGSRRYASQLQQRKEQYNCKAMLLIDMIGDKNLKITLPKDTAENLSQDLFNISKIQGTQSFFSLSKTSILDDHTPFQQLGIPSMDIIDFEYGPQN